MGSLDAPTVALLTAAGGALVAFARWAVVLWATVRREDVTAAKDNAAAQRADGARMVDALLEQARSNTALAAKIDALTAHIDTLVECRDRAPVPPPPSTDSERRRPERRLSSNVPEPLPEPAQAGGAYHFTRKSR